VAMAGVGPWPWLIRTVTARPRPHSHLRRSACVAASAARSDVRSGHVRGQTPDVAVQSVIGMWFGWEATRSIQAAMAG